MKRNKFQDISGQFTAFGGQMLVKSIRNVYALVLAIALFVVNLFAATSVKVFSFDESSTALNISKPRIYIQNTGTTTLTEFTYYYYFTNDDSKTPMLEDWYSPECDISLEQVSSNQYRLKYHVTGANFAPGQLLPDASGNVVGLHYNDWGTWDKTNDYSYNSSSTFTENTRIPVYVNGSLVCGTEPSGTGGTITREMWTNRTGTAVSDIPTTTAFNSTTTLSNLEEPQNQGVNYGTRIRGYITAPASGVYTFWIAGDDDCELWLSSNDRIENKSRKAYLNGWTNYQQWDKFTSQKSASITLTTGQRYYVEVLHKQGTGGDNLSVGWTKPNESAIVVIPGSVLTPFVAPNATPSLTANLSSPTQINLSWNDNCTNEDGYRVERSVSGGAYSQIADLPSNTTSFQNTGLTSSTAYSYRVRAYNSQGTSAFSNVFTLTTQEATSGVVVREVWLGVNGTSVLNIQTNTTPSLTTTMTTNLQEPTNIADNFGTRIRGYIQAPAGGSYTFWISSDDNSELWLSTDNQPAHKNKIASVTDWTNSLEWTKFPSQKSNPINLTTGAKYYFEVLHKEGTGGDNLAVGWFKPGQSGTPEIIPASVLWKFVAPVTPTNLAAVAVSGTQINLTWSDNSDNEDNFLVEQSTDGVNFTQIASKSPNTTSYSVTGLVPATAYTFRVRAINSAGNSDYSQTATVSTQTTTAGAISRQVWNSVNTCSIDQIPVNTAPASEGTLSLLQEPANYSDHFGTRVRGYLTAPEDGSYTFWISGDDDCTLWLSSSENPADMTRIAYFTGWTDPLQWDKFPSTQKSSTITLVKGKRYYIEVRHVDGIGNDHMAVGWTKPSDGTTASPVVIPGSVLSTFETPVAPSSLSATTISSTQIDLSWTDNSDNETGFLIERALGNQQNFTQVGMVGPGATSYACTGLDPNSQYQFRVRATNYAGNSVYSSNAPGMTGPPGDQGGPELTPQLLSFAIYSQDLSVVGQNSVFSGGGAVGSNTLVQVDIGANIGGNIVCGGNVELKDRVNVQGDITCGGTLSKVESAPPTISGTVTEHASVTHVDIPVKSDVVYGNTDFILDFDQTANLHPGSYRDLIVRRGATVTFTQGEYNFRSIFIDNNATILFDVPMDKTIEVNIETSVNLLDRAAAKFATKGYAPCVKIYTNTYSINIGNTVNLTGILTAPNAAVTINTGTRIEGAVYAKKITMLPGAVVVSNCINPDADDDGDCVPNLTEMVVGNAPDNGNYYTLMGVPHPAMIDNTQDQTVTYDFGCKYPYYSCTWSLTYPAGSLSSASVAPAYTLNNKPPTGIPDFNKTGYKPIGNYMSMIANSLNFGQKIRVALPLFSDVQPGISYSIAWYDVLAAQWQVTSASPLEACALLSDNPIGDVSSMIIVSNESNTVAYLDNGMVFSNEGKAKLRFNWLINASSMGKPTEDGGNVTISYLKNGIAETMPLPITNYKGFLLLMKDTVFTNKITITGISISSPNFSFTYTDNKNLAVDQGQCLTLEINRTIEEMKNSTVIGDKISAFYDVNALDFESMAFEEGVVKGDVNSWSYDYYLKDHLGSTRMVVADNGDFEYAYMYQPYGSVNNIITPPATALGMVREKFTGKELDQDGAINGAPGLELNYIGARYYDPAVGVWISTDPEDNEFNPYAYCSNTPIMVIDPNGRDGISPWVGVAIRAGFAAAGAYVFGSLENGNWNPGKWNWHDVNTYGAMLSGGITGYGLGSLVDMAISDAMKIHQIKSLGIKQGDLNLDLNQSLNDNPAIYGAKSRGDLVFAGGNAASTGGEATTLKSSLKSKSRTTPAWLSNSGDGVAVTSIGAWIAERHFGIPYAKEVGVGLGVTGVGLTLTDMIFGQGVNMNTIVDMTFNGIAFFNGEIGALTYAESKVYVSKVGMTPAETPGFFARTYIELINNAALQNMLNNFGVNGIHFP